MRDTVCGLTVSPRQGGHHPAHLAGGDAAQKGFPDHQRHLFGTALELVHHLRQKSPLAAAGNAQRSTPKRVTKLRQKYPLR
jgi:hypothetical protein